MWALLSPCEEAGQLIFNDDAICTLRDRFAKEAHHPDANASGAVVLTAIGFLQRSGQTKASQQLTRVLVEVVEAAQAEDSDAGKFDDFLGHVNETAKAFTKAPPKGALKAKDLIPIPRTFGR